MDAATFTFHTKPYELQESVWRATRDRRDYGIFWEMGTGKTWLAINTAAWLYLTGRIDAVLVVAPTDIHANWDVDGEGVRKHLHPDLLKDSFRITWHSSKAGNKKPKARWAAMLKHKEGMRWLFMGFDAYKTAAGQAAVKQYLATYRVLWVVDEAGRLKNPRSQLSKMMQKLTPLAEYRRPMTGSPVSEKPFDAYALVRWMMPGYWAKQQLNNFITFKYEFGVWRKQRVAGGREVDVLKTDKDGKPVYKNLDRLAKLLAPISSRVLKEDMVDLPPKIYTRYFYELSPKQRKLYDQLENDFMVFYESALQHDEDGDLQLLSTSADMAIVRQMRLQQIALGYLVSDTGEFTMIDERPPGLELLDALTEELTKPAIIWGRFRKDMDLILDVLGDRAVRYDGSVDSAGRVRNREAFQRGDKQFFVATQSAAGEGLTLTAAKYVFYYSNSFQLTQREQSEDRAHRIGQTEAVLYGDLLGRNTIAVDILDALVHKQQVAAIALGDRMRRRLGEYREA